MRILSANKGASNVSISKIQAPSNITDFMPRMYVACIYDGDWFVGNVTQISEQQNEIHVKFMKKKGKYFLWPTKTGQRWVPSFNRLGYIKSLLVQGNRSHTYFISHTEHRVYFKLKLSPTSGRCPQ